MASLDLGALEIFRCVAQAGSISGAAARLGRVQSNVSTRLKQLEEALGAPLFLRTRRGLIPTEAGRTLLDYADRLLALSREAAEALQDGRPRGTLRLGTMESTAAARLPTVLAAYHARYPEVAVHLHTDTAGGLMDGLRRGEIDAAFIAEPVPDAAFGQRPVFVESLVLIGPGNAPAACRPADLDGRTIVAFEEGCAYRRHLHEWLLEQGIAPRGTLSVGSYLAMIACVSAGAGYAVVPLSVLAVVRSGDTVRRYPLSGKYAAIRTMLARRRGYRSANLDALDALLPEVAERQRANG
ncbi:MAG: LysR substrate-binding domain-containing protein [Alphaproteobacteria bacterium]